MSARIRPVDAVAVALVVLSAAWRGWLSRDGFLTIDDFPILAQADARGLALDHLFGLYNNHFMPGGRLITVAVESLTGYAYRPYLMIMLAGHIVVGIAFHRLMRLMLPDGWLLLVPLCVFVFNPLTLEVSAWWAVGMNLLPMQLAMIVAVGAQVRYVRSGDRRHLLTLAVAVGAGLLFFEKALFAVPLVFLVTLCLYAPGGPVRALVTTVRRWWPAWAVLTGLAVFYLAAYLAMATGSTVRRPASAGEVGTFLGQYFGESLLPALVGGPWRWLDAGDGTPVVAPSEPARWVAWALVAALVAGTVWFRREAAVRAWTLLALFSLLAAGLIAATRLGSGFSGVAGLVPRYLGDVLLVAALCVGVAVCGLRRVEPAAEPAPVAVPLRRPVLLGGLAAALVLFVASSLVSGAGFARDWSDKTGRDYLRTARADLKRAETGTVFMDQPVPESVVPPMSYPWNMQSRFFGPVEDGPAFVTRARKLWVFDDAGHIRPAWVEGVRAVPGPLPGCGHRITGARAVTIPLQGELADYWQVMRISYLSDRDTVATVRVGDRPATSFDVHRGLNAMFLLMLVEGDEVEIGVRDPAANVCTDEIEVGALAPQPAG